MKPLWLFLASLTASWFINTIAARRLGKIGRWVVSTCLTLVALTVSWFFVQTDLAYGLLIVSAVSVGALAAEYPTLRQPSP